MTTSGDSIEKSLRRRLSVEIAEPDHIIGMYDEIDIEQRRSLVVSQRQMLHEVGVFLSQADQSLNNLERQQQEQEDGGVLTGAILRGCHDLAHALHQICDSLNQQTAEERRQFAQTCRDEMQYNNNNHLRQQHFLSFDDEIQEINAGGEKNFTESSSSSSSKTRRNTERQFLVPSDDDMLRLSEMNENDWIAAIDFVQNFLRDVEASLLSVDQTAAKELADVTITVARLFVSSLHSALAQIDSEDFSNFEPRGTTSFAHKMDIEIIAEHDDENHDKNDDDDDQLETERIPREKPRVGSDRIRVLWPPIGPRVSQCLHWIHQNAWNRPILSVALGIALWPAAVMTAILGTPLILMDTVLQNIYQHFQDTLMIEGLERGAAHLYHSGKLALVGGKFVGRQTLFVVQKQVERHGGVVSIVQNLAGMTVDRLLHPVETIQGAWSGIVWSSAWLQDFIRAWQDRERQQVAQELQL